MMVDTSVWIELLGLSKRFQIDQAQLESVFVCPPIIQEVVQGVRPGATQDAIREHILAINRVGDPVRLDHFLAGADIYSTGRRKGLTICSSIDCLIAAIAVENKLTVWHCDRDFEEIAKFTALTTTTKTRL
ncbi:MAG: PIN domain-containing protein [Deltaproteobacteria bacterium]|nr:PIN domain-containing protein [Deltaproteobacteria bacterium]MBI3293237.1 PIN domain-containing protein [Deltaproteobacteria bacterium]